MEAMTATKAILRLMSQGTWWSLWRLKAEMMHMHNVYAAETAISARLRELRRDGWKIERRPVPGRPRTSRAEEYRIPRKRRTR